MGTWCQKYIWRAVLQVISLDFFSCPCKDLYSPLPFPAHILLLFNKQFLADYWMLPYSALSLPKHLAAIIIFFLLQSSMCMFYFPCQVVRSLRVRAGYYLSFYPGQCSEWCFIPKKHSCVEWIRTGFAISHCFSITVTET